MSKHTPGPWTISHTTNRRVYMPDDNIEICPANSRTPICTMYRVNFDMHGIKDKANAHLIAAAPDMYEALQNAYAALQECGYQKYSGEMCAIRAALAKAEARS